MVFVIQELGGATTESSYVYLLYIYPKASTALLLVFKSSGLYSDFSVTTASSLHYYHLYSSVQSPLPNMNVLQYTSNTNGNEPSCNCNMDHGPSPSVRLTGIMCDIESKRAIFWGSIAKGGKYSGLNSPNIMQERLGPKLSISRIFYTATLKI